MYIAIISAVGRLQNDRNLALSNNEKRNQELASFRSSRSRCRVFC